MKERRPYWGIIIGLALLKLLLPFVLQSSVFELQRDEFLYYEQGKHFSLGYLENPPFLAWLGGIASWFGDPGFFLKLWPALIGAITVIITCLIAKELGGGAFAQLLAGIGIITGAFMRMHSLFQPNVLDILAWSSALYFLLKFLRSDETNHLYGWILSLALGWWGKYSIIFLAAAIVLALLISSRRKLFLQKRTWIGLGIGMLIILPNLWWQFDHRWPIIHHMKELQETQLQLLNPLDFIKDQFLYLVPMLPVWIGGLIWLFKTRQFRLLAWVYLFVIILLLAGRAKSYYSMGVYTVLLAAGGVAWEKWTLGAKWTRSFILIFILVLTLPFIPMLMPLWKPAKLASYYQKTGIAKTGMLKWEDQRDHPLPQDFADMLGWKELTTKTEKFFQTLTPAEQSDVVIFCRHYGQAGALKFYGKYPYFTDKVFTDNGSFLLWISNRPWFKHMIFIGRQMPGTDDRVFQHFQKISILIL